MLRQVPHCLTFVRVNFCKFNLGEALFHYWETISVFCVQKYETKSSYRTVKSLCKKSCTDHTSLVFATEYKNNYIEEIISLESI